MCSITESCLFRKTRALLLQLFYSRMCHLQSVSAGGFQALFPVPTFAFDVELKFQDGNTEYEKNNTYLKLTRDLKHDILKVQTSLLEGSRFRNWVEWVGKQH